MKTLTLTSLLTAAEREAEQSRDVFGQMTHRELVEIALTLLASEIRLRRQLDDATGVIR